VWELWGKAFNDQAAEQVVHRLITKDGAVKWVAGTWGPLVDETGHCVGIRGTCQDITERVLTERLLEETTQKFRTIVEEIAERERAEAALRESEERFRNMADTAPVMIWVSGPDKLCTFFNKVWLEFTGRTMEQELGSGWAVGVHPDDVNRCVGTYFTSFDARRSFQMEYRLLRADGKYRWVLDNGVPRFEPGGVFAGYIGSCLDITEIKRTLEASLASQKLETVGQLAGGIAHDFNNILGGVLFQADVALEELTGGNSPETELQGIRECAIRGAEIVRQLMFYSGKESDTSELVDVSRIVEEMLNLLRVSISKRATVATDLGKSLPSLRANPSQVRQIVMNLITNASEAIGDREGVIRIKTSRVTVSPDRFQTATEHLEAGDFLRLDVSDTGCGIPLEAQARVFDPFFTTKADGRGLGLAVVHGIVGGLGGTICLESEVGKGTTFQITMPCAEVRVTETNGQISSHGQRLSVSQGTILVVEDEDPIRRPVSKILQKTGFNVIEAADGYAALEMIRSPQKDIDILLLDVTLPGAPSREVYEEAMRLRPEMKIIVASAYSEEMAATALSEKVELFIRKPYGLGDLMDLIQQSLAWNHSRPTPRDDAEIGRKEQC
jgi:PAS domain S-box-containing protein